MQWFRNSQRVANSDILQFDGITLGKHGLLTNLIDISRKIHILFNF